MTAGTSFAIHAILSSFHPLGNAASGGAILTGPLITPVRGQVEYAMPIGRNKVRILGSLLDAIVCDIRSS